MKLKSHVFVFLPVLILLIGVVAHASPAHTFHTSLMQVEYNEKEQLVEISIQVFTHDLESVLSHRSNKDVRIDKTPEAAQLTLAYLNETINLKNRAGQVKTLSWVGMETQADAVWLYVEAKMPEGFDGLQVRDRIFFGVLDDQVNRVHIKHDEKKYDLVFKLGDDFKPTPPRPRVPVNKESLQFRSIARNLDASRWITARSNIGKLSQIHREESSK